MSADMSELAAFLLARIDEDEQAAMLATGETAMVTARDPAHEHFTRWSSTRVLAEVEAKRALVAFLDPTDAPEGEGRYVAEHALLLLALPYAGHEDFRQEWKP